MCIECVKSFFYSSPEVTEVQPKVPTSETSIFSSTIKKVSGDDLLTDHGRTIQQRTNLTAVSNFQKPELSGNQFFVGSSPSNRPASEPSYYLYPAPAPLRHYQKKFFRNGIDMSVCTYDNLLRYHHFLGGRDRPSLHVLMMLYARDFHPSSAICDC